MLNIPAAYDYDAFYRGSFVQRWWKRQIAETVWKWMPDAESIKIVDLGCGSSPIIGAYRLGVTPVGIEADPAKIEFARETFPHANYIQGDVRHTEFRDGTFNAVLAIEVIEHLPRSAGLLAEMARICEIGGNAIVATPDYLSPVWQGIEWAYKALKPQQYCDDHISHWTLGMLTQEAAACGWQYVRHRRVASADLIVMLERV